MCLSPQREATKHSFAEDVKQLDTCDLSVFHSTTYKFLSFYSCNENTDQLVSSPCPQCDGVGDSVCMYVPACYGMYVCMYVCAIIMWRGIVLSEC